MDDAAIASEFESLSTGGEQLQDANTGVEAQVNVPDIPGLDIDLGEQKFKLPYDHKLKVKHNGEYVETPLEQVLNAWREREHFSDKYKSFNQEKEQFEQQRNQFDPERFQTLDALQKWSEENPDQFDQIWNMYQQRDQILSQQSDDPVSGMVRDLQNQVKELSQFKNQFEQYQQQQQEAEDIEQVNSDIQKFQQEYGEKYGINLNEADEEGVKLETRILKHGIEKGITDFMTAASSYLLPTLIENAQHKGRTETAKAVRSDKRAGILGRSDTPSNGETKFDPRGLSEQELEDRALAEFQSMLNV